MLRHLTWKPDFDKTIERFAAWWHCQVIDRPPVTLNVRPSRPHTGPVASHSSLRHRWLDPEFAVESAIARMQRRDYIADTFPVFWPNVGPEITATILGCDLEFSEDSSWSIPIIHDPQQWHDILDRPFNFDNIYWQTIERITDLAIQRSDGRYIVGITDLHDSYDILAALRDPQALCLDLIDCPDLIHRVSRRAADVFIECFQRQYAKISAAGMGSSTWIRAYHEGPYYVPSCDFWCMVSPQMARDLVYPDLLVEMAPLERSIFHLDGPAALPHLGLLLDTPNLNGIQWVYGAGRGPAARWIDVYKRCVSAGKCVQVLAEDPADALAVLQAVGPRGVWLEVGGEFQSIDEADAFLKQVERLSCKSATAESNHGPISPHYGVLMNPKNLLSELKTRTLLCDGAMGTQLMLRGLAPGSCGELWNAQNPAAVESIHRAYRQAGCDLITTNTFGGTRFALDRHGLAARAAELNRAGAQIAPRKQPATAAGYSATSAPSATSSSPWATPSPRSSQRSSKNRPPPSTTAAPMPSSSKPCPIRPRCPSRSAPPSRPKPAPVIATYAFGKQNTVFRTMMGTTLADALAAAIDAGADVVGANCGTSLSLDDYLRLAEQLVKSAGKTPAILQPNAGSPRTVDGKLVYPASPVDMAAIVAPLRKQGLKIIGGCCGTTPEHLKVMSTALRP